MNNKIREGYADDPLGNELLSVLMRNNNGAFPAAVSDSEIRSALQELNRDTSDYMMRIAKKSLMFKNVKVSGAMESKGDAIVDALIGMAAKGHGIDVVLEKRNRKSADKMASKALFKLNEQNGWPMAALYSSDGALLAATEVGRTSADPYRLSYWPRELTEGGDWVLVELELVPQELIQALEAQGTRYQEFRDGYEAAEAAAPYVRRIVDYGEYVDTRMIDIPATRNLSRMEQGNDKDKRRRRADRPFSEGGTGHRSGERRIGRSGIGLVEAKLTPDAVISVIKAQYPARSFVGLNATEIGAGLIGKRVDIRNLDNLLADMERQGLLDSTIRKNRFGEEEKYYKL